MSPISCQKHPHDDTINCSTILITANSLPVLTECWLPTAQLETSHWVITGWNYSHNGIDNTDSLLVAWVPVHSCEEAPELAGKPPKASAGRSAACTAERTGNYAGPAAWPLGSESALSSPCLLVSAELNHSSSSLAGKKTSASLHHLSKQR